MSAGNLNYQTADGSSLTPAQIARLEVLEAKLGDNADIPPTQDPAWASAVRGKHAARKPRETPAAA